jgi:hypothetical protein
MPHPTEPSLSSPASAARAAADGRAPADRCRRLR